MYKLNKTFSLDVQGVKFLFLSVLKGVCKAMHFSDPVNADIEGVVVLTVSKVRIMLFSRVKDQLITDALVDRKCVISIPYHCLLYWLQIEV